MKIAIIHDWLTGMRGGEKCLEVFCRLLPEADLFTLIHVPGSVSPVIEKMRPNTSFLQYLPFAKEKYRYYLPVMPLAVEFLDLREYDFILSSSHCVAKGILKKSSAVHLCYCYTPMRYIWDQYDQYFGGSNSNSLASKVMPHLVPILRRWDVRASRRVDRFFAISKHVKKRISKYYNREAKVIYPPVDTGFYSPTGEKPKDFFLMVSAFAPYKRLDLAVEAFNKLGYPLKIIGEGQDSFKLKQLAGPNIEFLGWLPDRSIRSYYAHCRAFIFPGEEDFGITPLEAQAMGRPVIAYGKGGALETVIPDSSTWKPEYNIPMEATERPTGIFFAEQTVAGLTSAVKHFESIEDFFKPKAARENALNFDTDIFSQQIQAEITLHKFLQC
jgi:glycosyltransferase involved in cell wall biosynthesis